MDEKMTMEITNDRLEEAIKQYAAERTKENLTTVLNLLRPTKLYVPAMLKAPDQPTPCFLKNNKGEQFFVAYTSKEQMPEEPKSQALLFMPFPACNNIVVKPELELKMCIRDRSAVETACEKANALILESCEVAVIELG